MNRGDLVLAALASAGPDAALTPVKVQKLFFLVDREMSGLTGGPHFNFEPYDYGPFDRGVYEALEELSEQGLVRIDESCSYRRYSLTSDGFLAGSKNLGKAPPPVREYLTSLTNWLGKVSFAQLVSEIYRRYPDTKVNSVFRQ